MEEADEDLGEAREQSVLFENEDDDLVEVNIREEKAKEDKDGQKRLISLQRDFSNIQIAADAKIVQQRKQLEEAERIRAEQIENAHMSCEEIPAEFERLLSVDSQRVTNSELKKTFESLQQQCNSIIQEKYAVINDLQQEIKLVNKRHVNSLSENAKEIDLICKTMEDQVKMLTTANREKLEETERIHQQEMKALREKHDAEYEEVMKKCLDKKLGENKVEAMEKAFQQMNIDYLESFIKELPKVPEREHEKHTDMTMFLMQKIQTKQKKQPIEMTRAEILKEIEEYTREQNNLSKRCCKLSEEYKSYIQKYESLSKQMKNFAVKDAKQTEDIWKMTDEEIEGISAASVLSKKYCGPVGEQPQMAFLKHTDTIQPQELSAKLRQSQSKTEKCSQWMLNASSELSLDSNSNSPDTEVYKEGAPAQSESSPESEERNLFSKKQMEVLELLCDEADLLIEPKVLKALAFEQREKRTAVKLNLLCDGLGINVNDTPQLADFLLEYEQKHREQTEDTCAESSGMAAAAKTSSMTNSISDLIHPDHILPALLSFLEQYSRFRDSSDHHLPSFGQTEGQSTSKDFSHWESLANITSEDRLIQQDSAEIIIEQYHGLLTEISDLVSEQ